MRKSRTGGITMAAMVALAAWPADARAADAMALGQHLAQECTSCHRLDGINNGIPAIAGHNADDLVKALTQYKTGQRSNPAMTSVAQSLDDEQIRALALYWGSLPAAPPAKAPAPARKP